MDKVSDWCKKHRKDILITVAIVVRAVFAIVVFSGGMALAPFIAGLLTTFGRASTMTVTVATVTSLIAAGIAVTSTIAASVLNIIDIWGDMGDNKTFQSWKTVMNWASAISNLFYSAGMFYNSINGITCTQTGEIFNNGIAIGEKMATRVVPYATNNGLGYYNGLRGFNIINKISPKFAAFLGTIQNRNLINWSMLYGINIFDIGLASSQITSVFYQMEQSLFKIILH